MTVLRNESLSDIHVGHNFNPGKNGRLKPFGRSRFFDQHSVNAVFDFDAVFKGLNMDIAGTGFDSFQQNQIDQIHQGGLTGQFMKFGRSQLPVGLHLRISIFLSRHEVFQHSGDIAAVIFQDCFFQFGRTAVASPDSAAGDKPKILKGLRIKGVSHRDSQLTIVLFQGENIVLRNQFRRNFLKNLRLYGNIV